MYLIYDTETTGLPKDEHAPLTDSDNWPRLVQIAWQLHDHAGKLVEAQNFIVKPEGFSIPFNAEKVHGISTQRATDEGKPLDEVLAAFAQAVGKTQLIVGHNIKFDLNIMGAEYLRKTDGNALEGKAFLDTKEESTDFVAIPAGKGGRFKWPTLTELHRKLFNEDFEDAHDAAYDVRATARCFFGLLTQKVVKPLDETLPENIVYEPPILDEANFAKRKSERGQASTGALEGEKIDLPEDYTFTHLHLHSQYSLLQSTAGVKAIMKKAKEKGMTAVAVTDLGNLYGAYNATAYGADEGLKVIIGCDVFLSDKRTQTQFTKNQSDHRTLALLLAKHKAGYTNLAKLCSLGHIEGMYANFPRVDKELIKKYSEGLMAVVGGFETEIYNKILEEGEEAGERALQWWMEVFRDDLYLEICRHGLEAQDYVNSVLVRLGRKYQIKYVATNNVFYLDKKDAEAHDTLLAVKDGKPKSEPKQFERGLVDYIRGKRRFGFPNDEFYLKSTDEMKELFADLPEALLATQEIVDKCEAYKLKSSILMPKYEIPPEFETQDDYLRYLAYEGAKRHYGEPLAQEVIDRLDFELNVIKNMGFPGYFLIVQDFINEGRKMGVFVGPGRGCLTADARVVMPNGTTKFLPEVQIGDSVITHDGSTQRVTNTMRYKVKEELLTIKTYYGDAEGISLTKDHKVLVEKQPKHPKYNPDSKTWRKLPDIQGETTWLPAENVEVGDWVFVPKPKIAEQELAYFDLAEFSNGHELHHDEEFVYHDALNPVGKPIHSRMKKAKRYLHLDEDWYTILGLFVGDGWFDSKNTPAVNFIFNATHKDKIDFLKNKVLEQGFSISENHNPGAVIIDVRSRQLQLLFKKLFCHYEHKPQTKHVPDLVMRASEKNVLAFLKGYLWADGHQAEHKIRFTTVSRKLADQVRFLCWRVGIPASLGKEERKGKREIRKGSGEYFKKIQPSYNVTIPKDDRIGEKQAKTSYFYKPVENGVLLKVREVSTIESPPSGKEIFVYDIEVENNANYLTSSFLVHNSAAGSAVAYCVGITNIDPIKYDLLFERFLNPERVSMPDIDIDFDDAGRQSVIDYVINKYGKNQVAQIITYGTMAAKMAIKDVARALEMDLTTSNQLAKYVPEKPGTKLKDAFAEIQELKEVLALTDDPRTKVLQDALVLEGSIRGTGIHAAGVIIAPKDLLECVPVCTAKDSDLWVTQFDGKVIESAGMLKMDFLGLKTLTIIKDALEFIKQTRGIEIDIDNIPMDDPKTFELYQGGNTIATFQFESEGMQMYLRQLKPNNIEDLIAMNAIYRPGPLQFIPLYIDRKHGRETVEFPHPLLEAILGKTFGIMIYQEQIMQTAQVLGGYSLGGADLLRRAMGKKDKNEMDKQRAIFVKGSQEKNAIPEDKANEIFDIMAKFAEYGFNRSHSAAYSVVAYQTAYLKANYPSEYMAAVLSHNMTIEKITFFLEECQRMGVQVLGPDVNDSETGFSVNEQGQIRFGLAAIKGTGEAAVESIIEERNKNGKFKSIFDFVQRLNLRTVNKKSLESLAQAGGFDGFGIDRASYFATGQDGAPFIEKLLKYGNAFQKDQENAGASLFGGGGQAQIATPAIPEGQAWSKLEQLNREKEVVGFYISGHPLNQYRTALASFRAVPLSRLSEFDRQEIFVGGIITSKNIKQGNRGAFTTFMLEDYQSSLELALFGSANDLHGDKIEPGLLVLIKGKVQLSYRGDRHELRISEIQPLEEVKGKYCKGIRLMIDVKRLDAEFIEKLHKTIMVSSGETPLHITLFDTEEKHTTELTSQKYKVSLQESFFMRLDSMKIEAKMMF